VSTINIRGVELSYAVFGDQGRWLALSPGGRRGMTELIPLAERLAEQQLRVLLHDRRNCGGSEVEISGDDAEYEIWADDLYQLLNELEIGPVAVGGSSSGARLAISLALRHPEVVSALVLWRLTGGRHACKRLGEKYYRKYIDLARAGGMIAVCESEDFAETIASRPLNRSKLLGMPVGRFIEIMEKWAAYFDAAIDHPLIGATDSELKRLRMPALIVPGNDETHPRWVGEKVAGLLPCATLRTLSLPDRSVDVSPEEEWQEQEAEIARLITTFLRSGEGNNSHTK